MLRKYICRMNIAEELNQPVPFDDMYRRPCPCQYQDIFSPTIDNKDSTLTPFLLRVKTTFLNRSSKFRWDFLNIWSGRATWYDKEREVDVHRKCRLKINIRVCRECGISILVNLYPPGMDVDGFYFQEMFRVFHCPDEDVGRSLREEHEAQLTLQEIFNAAEIQIKQSLTDPNGK